MHAGVMAYHAFADAGELGYMWGDVGALVLVALVLALVTPRGASAMLQPA